MQEIEQELKSTGMEDALAFLVFGLHVDRWSRSVPTCLRWELCSHVTFKRRKEIANTQRGVFLSALQLFTSASYTEVNRKTWAKRKNKQN